MTEERIEQLKQKGFIRWTKGSMDRLYINASMLGLECSYYKTGNISDAYFDGDSISNSEARRMKSAKTYIDVRTDRVFSDNDKLLEAAKKLAEIE